MRKHFMVLFYKAICVDCSVQGSPAIQETDFLDYLISFLARAEELLSTSQPGRRQTGTVVIKGQILSVKPQ